MATKIRLYINGKFCMANCLSMTISPEPGHVQLEPLHSSASATGVSNRLTTSKLCADGKCMGTAMALCFANKSVEEVVACLQSKTDKIKLTQYMEC